MNTAEWIGICIIVNAIACFTTWAITYVVMATKEQRKCDHEFKEVMRVDVPGFHKVAYVCGKCGKTKKVSL